LRGQPSIATLISSIILQYISTNSVGMKKNKLLALVMCGMFNLVVNGQTTTSFRKNYDISLFDIPMNAIEGLTPNTYVFAGIHALSSSITAVDNVGVTSWSRRFTSGISLFIGDVKKDDSQNRYYVCGGVDSGPAFLFFLDANGNFISGRNFSISQASGASFNRVIKTTDGGYLCVGTVTGYDPDGGGPEVQFSPVTHNPPECSSSKTESIQSPLIVKFDAAGNHVWHHVFRYYVSSATPANRIYNDASFVDVVEISDGYIAVGSYDVNNVFSVYDTSDGNSCGEDRTPTDAMIAKFSFAGAIQYHRQIDNPSNSTSQSSKSFSSASKTAAGLPLFSASDGSGRPMVLMRFAGSGGWANPTWIRKYGASNINLIFDIIWNPFQSGRFFETSDGNYAVWGFHIPGLTWNNVLMKMNTSGTIQWSRHYTNDLAVILPHGEQSTDGGFIGVSYTLAGTGHDLHLMKTDSEGNMSAACAATNVSVSQETPSYTWVTPIYNAWSANTVTNGAFTPTVANITPTESIQCLTVVAACTPPSAPTTVTATPSTICQGESTTITASGPSDPNVTYNVYAAASGGTSLGATPYTVSPGTTTTYYVEAVDNSDPNCVSTTRTSVTVTVTPGPTASNAGTNQDVCGNSATLAGNTPTNGTGTWTLVSGAGTITDPSAPSSTVTGLGTGANVFEWTITSGSCPPSSSQVTITSFVNPTTSNAGTDQSLCASSATLDGNTPTVGTGVWTLVSGSGTITTPSSPNSTVTGLGTGPNVFQWTISNGPCPPSSDQVTITNTGAPTDSDAGPDQEVCGNSTILAGNTPVSGTGIWTLVSGTGTITDPSSPNSTVTGLGTGENVFQWTISNGACTPSSSQVTITSVTPPTIANAGTDQTICGTTINLNGNTPTIGAGTWTLESGSGTIMNPSSPTSGVTGLGVGSNVFQWTITNGSCPPSSAQVTITNTGGPSAVIENIQHVSCNGLSDGQGTVSASGGTPEYSYQWSPQGGTGATSTLLPAGTYTVVITDNLGCTADVEVVINEPDAITLVTSSNSSSCATPDGWAEVIASGGTGLFTYSWSPTGGNSSLASNLGAGNYTVTVTDGNGCEQTTSVTVGLADGPEITVNSVSDVSCNGSTDGSASISVSGGDGNYSYSWSPSGGNASSASGLAPGSYTVIVADGSGCEVFENILIGEPLMVGVTGVVNNADCSGNNGSISVVASGGTGSYSYLWSPNGETSSSITGLSGNYSVVVTDGNGCQGTQSFTIGLTNNLDATILPGNTTIEGGESVQLEVELNPDSPGATYTWTPGDGLSCTDCPNPIASPAVTTTYVVSVLTDEGCSDTAMVTIFITTPCGDLFMPTIFSPNADGLNDELCVLGGCIVEMDLKIYNRWGEMVFESNSPSICWDGTFRGKPMNSAVFVYKLFVRTSDGQEIEESGNVNLVR
jgi:gliding motility-associated-like protein